MISAGFFRRIFLIFIITTLSVSEALGTSYKDRNHEYDLSKGPVTYEAYYPDKIQLRNPFVSGVPIIEKTYQSYDSDRAGNFHVDTAGIYQRDPLDFLRRNRRLKDEDLRERVEDILMDVLSLKVIDRELASRNAEDNSIIQSREFREHQEVQPEIDYLSQENPMPTEDIFRPRPQVIQYIFSPAIKVPPPKSDAKVAQAQPDPVVSIKVSEEPRHKIRHHHGEKRRNAINHNKSDQNVN